MYIYIYMVQAVGITPLDQIAMQWNFLLDVIDGVAKTAGKINLKSISEHLRHIIYCGWHASFSFPQHTNVTKYLHPHPYINVVSLICFLVLLMVSN